MIILEKLYEFNMPVEEMINIYILKKGKLNDLFPLINKNINTRPHEKFYVTRAKTERLAKSTVPYLQRLLNQN